MSFKYIKNLLFIILIIIIIFNYLDIKLFTIRENNENIKTVKADCPKSLKDNNKLCENWLHVKVDGNSFKNKKK